MSQITHSASILLDIQAQGSASKAVGDLANVMATLQPLANQGTGALSRGLSSIDAATRNLSGGLAQAVERSRELLALGQAQAHQRESMAFRQHQQMQTLAGSPLAARQSFSMQARHERSHLELQHEQQLQALQMQQAMAAGQSSPAGQQQQGSGAPAFYQGMYQGGSKIANAPGHAMDALLGKGASGAAGMAAAGFAAGYGGTTAVLGKTAEAMDILNNSFTSGAQKSDALFEKFVPGGTAILNFRDAINGVADALRKIDVAHQVKMFQQEKESNLLSVMRREQATVTTHELRAGAMGAAVMPGIPGSNRDTFQGDIEYHKQARLFPLQANLARAQAESAAARSDVEASQERMNELRSTAADARDRKDRAILDVKKAIESESGAPKSRPGKLTPFGTAMATMFAPAFLGMHGSDKFFGTHFLTEDTSERDKAGRARAGAKALEASEGALQAERQVQEEIARLKERGTTAAEKESAVRKGLIAIARTELEFLKEKEQRGSSQAMSLAGMGPGARAANTAMALMMKNMSPAQIAMLPPQIISQASAVAGPWVNKQLERAGRDLPEHKALVAAGMREDVDLRAVREEIGRKALAVEVKMTVDAESLHRQIADAIANAMRELSISIRHEIDVSQDRKWLERQQALNAASR